MNDPKFNVGDEVVLATGKSVQTVMQVCYFTEKQNCYRHR